MDMGQRLIRRLTVILDGHWAQHCDCIALPGTFEGDIVRQVKPPRSWHSLVHIEDPKNRFHREEITPVEG